ncbi:MAG: acyl-CoA dehydrogenase family protein [Alphaproteobacteria bacterium]|nr:acyl-CoA dehydrogenase family protein [Alphaproteobacteria bacterium]
MSTKRQAGAPSREELMGRAWDLLPVLRERAQQAEDLGRLPDETERDFHDTGLFRAFQPASIGGSELDFGDLIELGDIVGRACGSSAWNLTNLSSHHWMLAMFPKQIQDEVWNKSVDTLIATSFVFPAGKARRTEGGFTISGRWPFCSGIDPCDWSMLGGMVAPEDGDGPPEMRIFMLHRSQYEILDTWHVSGLSGTGSKDIEVAETFVPEYRTLSVEDIKNGRMPGCEVNTGPLFRIPMFAVFPYVLCGTALGIAQGAWDGHVGALRKKASAFTGAKLGDFQAVQIAVGEAAAEIDAARLIMRTHTADAMEIARRGELPDLDRKVKYRRDGAWSVKLCVDAVDRINRLAGGGGLYLRSPIQRAFRDVHAVASHISFNTDVAGTTFGRVALGLPLDNPTI